MDIPILNQPAEVLFWWPTSLIKCNCQERGVTLVIVSGFGNAAACPKCNKVYIATGLLPDGKTMQIQTMLPAPASTIQ